MSDVEHSSITTSSATSSKRVACSFAVITLDKSQHLKVKSVGKARASRKFAQWVGDIVYSSDYKKSVLQRCLRLSPTLAVFVVSTKECEKEDCNALFRELLTHESGADAVLRHRTIALIVAPRSCTLGALMKKFSAAQAMPASTKANTTEFSDLHAPSLAISAAEQHGAPQQRSGLSAEVRNVLRNAPAEDLALELSVERIADILGARYRRRSRNAADDDLCQRVSQVLDSIAPITEGGADLETAMRSRFRRELDNAKQDLKRILEMAQIQPPPDQAGKRQFAQCVNDVLRQLRIRLVSPDGQNALLCMKPGGRTLSESGGYLQYMLSAGSRGGFDEHPIRFRSV